ncbi:ATPase family AAA domain-containing protein 3B [Achaetomium macrosporum]|uniref:ATPase family AAA domain-containing protein 3B n=1 Tax=Achaetomium macrosporum TaxID=79813 RepID=A0AAN7HAZ8_9PEZI|nr:ATPase family AAA domain-containing protein 3B [Achaetomium macrosporum]
MPDDEKPTGHKTRYNIIVNRYDAETGKRVDIEKAVTKPKSKEKKTDRAFTFRKFLKLTGGDEISAPDGSEFEIESEPLQRLLARSPYQTLIYCWETAEAEAERNRGESEEDTQARKDLKELLLLISTSSGNEDVDQFFKDRQTLQISQKVTFSALWTLFPRGTEIVGKPFQNQEQLFFVSSCDPPCDSSSGNAPEEFHVNCYGYDWDGLSRSRVPYRMSIPRFPDKKDISELPFYPLKYHKDRGGNKERTEDESNEKAIQELKERLKKRGEAFWNFSTRDRGKQMFSYDGFGYYHQRGAGLFHSSSSLNVSEDSRSIFSTSDDDSRTPLKPANLRIKGTYQPSKQPLLGDMTSGVIMDCDCGDCRVKFEHLARFSWDRKGQDNPTAEQLMFLPPRILGYALEQKRWVQIGVNDLKEPPEADQTNFEDKLQLNDEYKSLIKRAVKAHSENKTKNIVDYAPEKGKGLVILLWGLPGVGKTPTAESVAALAGKPLVFDLAGLWESVLLFDEADVFLEARDSHKNDMQRSTIVSVLLRVLEYFSGILILTTNRLKSFDIAVQSRIRIAIEYKDLSEAQRQRIFLSFLEQLERKSLVENMRKVEDWVKETCKENNFNGRQIRNIVSTAMAIANADGERLGRKHLQEVKCHVSDFKRAASGAGDLVQGEPD